MRIVATLCAVMLAAVPAPAQDAKAELKKKISESYVRAADKLVGQQTADGAWAMNAGGRQAPSVAYTGLIVAALADGPADIKRKYADAVSKGCEYMVKKQNQDGSFGEGEAGTYLKTYTSACALMALSLADPQKYKDAIGNARGYLKHNQVKEEGIDRGGMGYGDESPGGKKGIANLSTTGFAAEGMARSGLPQDDQFWKLAVEYVKRCQNSSEVNTDKEFVAKLKEKGLSVGDDGGLYYAANPDKDVHKAGTTKVMDKEVIVSYGSMTYHGIKTYLYAGLRKDSPEVKAAVDWVRKNWNVEQHPGFPFDDKKRNQLRGLFYYYNTMARAMEALGENPFTTFDGKKHDWAVELGGQLLKLEDAGTWVNENAAWFEDDRTLVTAYVLNALNAVHRNLK